MRGLVILFVAFSLMLAARGQHQTQSESRMPEIGTSGSFEPRPTASMPPVNVP